MYGYFTVASTATKAGKALCTASSILSCPEAPIAWWPYWRFMLKPVVYECHFLHLLLSSLCNFFTQLFSLNTFLIWFLKTKKNIVQNIYFIKCAVLTPVPPPFRFPLHKIQNIFQLSFLSKHVYKAIYWVPP